jgi:ribosomal protein L29
MSFVKKNLANIITICTVVITLLAASYDYGIKTATVNMELRVLSSKIEDMKEETTETIAMSSLGLKIFILDSLIGKSPDQLEAYLDSLKMEFIESNMNKSLIGSGLP